MSKKIVECVPNFSEGKDLQKIEQILDCIREVAGAELIDVDPGAQTNRTVVTIVGEPEAVKEAAFRAIAKAGQLIDMRTHSGAHARHGATDVCPFVPVAGMTMEECAKLAAELGQRVGDELQIPVYLYDQAALRPERESLAQVRAGEYEALPKKLGNEEWKPDFGPNEFTEAVAKTGVVTIGAREFLIAYNVNLNSRGVDHANDIAFEIREKGRAARKEQSTPYYQSGSLLKFHTEKQCFPCAYCYENSTSLEDLKSHYQEKHDRDLLAELEELGRDVNQLDGLNALRKGRFEECRAVGWMIPEYQRAQISINLTNYKVTSAHEVLEECRRLAIERGLNVTGSEIVGVVPYEAMLESGKYYLALQGSSAGIPIGDLIECAIQSMGLRDIAEFTAEKSVLGMPEIEGTLNSMSVVDFVHEVSRPSPTPGGGSIAALAGSLGSALSSMVANLTFGKKKFAKVQDQMEASAIECQKLKDSLLKGIDEDTEAFNSVMDAMRLPKGSEAETQLRQEAIQAGYKEATLVPLQTAKDCLESMKHCKFTAENGLAASITDSGVGSLMAFAGLQGAIYNVRINLKEITDKSWVESVETQLQALLDQGQEICKNVDNIVNQAIR